MEIETSREGRRGGGKIEKTIMEEGGQVVIIVEGKGGRQKYAIEIWKFPGTDTGTGRTKSRTKSEKRGVLFAEFFLNLAKDKPETKAEQSSPMPTCLPP